MEIIITGAHHYFRSPCGMWTTEFSSIWDGRITTQKPHIDESWRNCKRTTQLYGSLLHTWRKCKKVETPSMRTLLQEMQLPRNRERSLEFFCFESNTLLDSCKLHFQHFTKVAVLLIAYYYLFKKWKTTSVTKWFFKFRKNSFGGTCLRLGGAMPHLLPHQLRGWCPIAQTSRSPIGIAQTSQFGSVI